MTEIGTGGKNEIEESKGDEEMKRGRGVGKGKEEYMLADKIRVIDRLWGLG